MNKIEPSLTTETPISVVYGCLVTMLQGELYQDILERVKQDVLNKISFSTVKGIIFDMSGVKVLDSHSFDNLVEIAKTTRLLGVETVFVSLQPGVVSALVDLDVDITGFLSFLNMEEALSYLNATCLTNDDSYETEEDHSLIGDI
ncbi:MAG: STAS domain-containing protein [Firmicutes bacterium]|nr:STAS domain-containing protein [Bacillota bacterium]